MSQKLRHVTKKMSFLPEIMQILGNLNTRLPHSLSTQNIRPQRVSWFRSTDRSLARLIFVTPVLAGYKRFINHRRKLDAFHWETIEFNENTFSTPTPDRSKPAVTIPSVNLFKNLSFHSCAFTDIYSTGYEGFKNIENKNIQLTGKKDNIFKWRDA